MQNKLSYGITENMILHYRYECVTLGELNEQKYFYWNKTISEHCCLHCDGTVYKADSVIESVVEEDECGTIKTSVCRKNDEGFNKICSFVKLLNQPYF